MRWKRWLFVLLVVLLLGVPALLLHRLLYTQQGLEFVLARLQGLESVRIEVTGARGVIAGPLSFDRVVVDHAAVRVVADDLRGTPSIASLVAGRIALTDASVGRAEVTLKDRGPQPATEIHFLPAWLSIVAHDATVKQAGVTLKNGRRLHVESIRGSVRLTRWRLDVDPFAIEDRSGRIGGKVFLRGSLPLGLRGEASGLWRLPDGHEYRFAARVAGDLDRLGVDASITQPARLAFAGTALDLTREVRAIGTVRVIDFDGSPWIPRGRLPSLSGSIAVDARRDAIGVDGTLTSPVFGTEPVRVHGSGRSADDVIDVVSLKAWLPRSAMSLTTAGTVRFAEHAPALQLEGEWTALRWPLSGDPVVESRVGHYKLAGGLPYAFDVVAEARGPKIPAADFKASGSIDRDQLLLDRAAGTVLKGQLSGSGRVSWAGDQPWRAQFDARSLDVAGLRPDLTGRIDIAGEIEGRGFTAAAPWTIRVGRLSGTLLGRALTGSGEIAYRDSGYEFRRVRVANAASHVDIDGRWGPSIDLRWSADLRSLNVLEPSLHGELLSAGVAHGTQARPQVTGEASVRHLRYGSLAAQSLEAEVDVDFADRRDSRVQVEATAVDAGGLDFESLRLVLKGRTSDHDITLQAASQGNKEHRIAGFKAALAASGAADLAQRAWRGVLNEASFDFPDGSARLAQPTALDLGPSLVKSAPLCLVTGEARLCAEGEWHGAQESWRVLYSAQDWPLRRLLTSLLGRREFDGKLQASGWAEQQPGHDWVGGAALILDQPTFDVRRNRTRTETVELGSGRVDFHADQDEFRAVAELKMAASTQMRGQVTARRQRGRALAESPLSGEVDAESSVLTALPLFVPEIDRSEGRLNGSVHVGGTLGDPRFNGDFHLRDGRLDLYRTNLSLTAATLDGRFEGDTLEFDGNATSRKGPVTLSGRFTWPEGVMTGSMRLKGDNLLVADTPEYRIQASPDLTVAADAGKFTVTGEVLIPTARISPKDLSSSVSTSDDERIVGGEVEETGPSTMQRVHSTIHVRLGDDVRVQTYGLNAHLGGEVTVRTEPGDRARGNGAINVIDGEYKAFGVYVKITKGVLSYRDAPLAEPTLDLVAEREIKDEDIKVAVNVRGQLDNPFITLSSEPAMPNNEALSYLLTGRSINTLQSNEAASVNRAAESLAVSGGGLLLGGLSRRLGLDEVSVESTTGKNATTTDTQVVLGKFLSPKLFVSYGISIAEAINTIKLRYTLNPRWSLRAEAGLEQSADIEYRIER
jgi:translocation and assembly module TamB